MFERILVPLDESKTAEIVLPYVEEIGGKFGSRISLAGVAESGPGGKEGLSTATPTIDRDDLYRLYLTDVGKRIIAEGKEFGMKDSNVVDFKLLKGDVAKEILRYAGGIKANLIAISNHGVSIEGPWVLGNIASKILRAADCPVLLIRKPASDDAIKNKWLFKRVVLPLDGSRLGEAAIPMTEMLANKLGVEVILASVVEPATRWGMYDTNPAQKSMDTLDERKSDAATYLEGVAKSLKEKGLDSSSVVLFGVPARQIVSYAKDNAIDLIAMSTHGRSGIGQWVFGSVTDKVLHAGDTPVLVVRPEKS